MKIKTLDALDGNYKSKGLNGSAWKWSDAFSEPFSLEGFPYIENGVRSRLPLAVAKSCEKPGVLPMSKQCAGATIRFKSDSPELSVKATFTEIFRGCLLSASCGFDLYQGKGASLAFIGNRYVSNGEETFETTFSELGASDELRDYSLFLPLHCAIDKLEIGVRQGSRLAAPDAHAIKKPVVFHGSSITNCAGVGRPGMTYPAQAARILDFQAINMGFSGSCLGEPPVAEAIAKLDLAALVLEYDDNAPDEAFLARTHAPFFKRFRSLRPEIPAVLLSACRSRSTATLKRRRDIVMRTFLEARASGDSLVEFIDGDSVFDGAERADCTLDGCHPNDLGCRMIALHVAEKLKKLPLGF